MKKSLVALAALALAGVASAQSSVTLFGTVDAAITNVSTKSNAYNLASPYIIGANGQLALNPAALTNSYARFGQKQSQTFLASSGMNSSKIGFRGVEDLGGGLAAGFWLEAGLGNDAGNGGGRSGAFNFNRRSTVSLSGPFGEIRLGRDYTPTFWNDTVFDPYGTNGVGTSLISVINGNLAVGRGPGSRNNGATSPQSASDNYVRTNNSVGYFLPPNLGGFYGQVQYALPENVKSSSGFNPAVAGTPFQTQELSTTGRYVGGRFGYANGPLDVAVSYGQSTYSDASGSLTLFPTTLATESKGKLNTANVGASYDFGVVKLFGEIAQTRDKFNASSSLTNALVPGAFAASSASQTDKYTGYLLGVSVPLGAGQIKASYAHVKFDNGVAVPFLTTASLFNTTTLDSSANKLALGYIYNLSKRTALYTTVSRTRIKDGQNNPGIMGAGSGGGEAAGYLATSGAAGYAPRSNTAYSFGITHAF
jgi:predicted porin